MALISAVKAEIWPDQGMMVISISLPSYSCKNYYGINLLRKSKPRKIEQKNKYLSESLCYTTTCAPYRRFRAEYKQIYNIFKPVSALSHKKSCITN